MCGTQDMIKSSFTAPFKTGLLRSIIGLVLGGGHKCPKTGLEMEVKLGVLLTMQKWQEHSFVSDNAHEAIPDNQSA